MSGFSLVEDLRKSNLRRRSFGERSARFAGALNCHKVERWATEVISLRYVAQLLRHLGGYRNRRLTEYGHYDE